MCDNHTGHELIILTTERSWLSFETGTISWSAEIIHIGWEDQPLTNEEDDPTIEVLGRVN